MRMHLWRPLLSWCHLQKKNSVIQKKFLPMNLKVIFFLVIILWFNMWSVVFVFCTKIFDSCFCQQESAVCLFVYIDIYFFVIYGPCSFSIFCRRGGCSYAKLRGINNVHNDAIQNFIVQFFSCSSLSFPGRFRGGLPFKKDVNFEQNP